jgi:endonuclease/exonuclease/phosphatase family metal-dependent hydrolase
MDPLTVTTYNVRHAVLDEEPDTWERRQAGVAERLRAADPDVVGLQESAGDQQADVAAALPAYSWVGVADEPGTGEHNPIGYGPRLTLLDAGTTWLSESGSPGSVGWDAAYTRVLTEARFQDEATGLRFTAYNTHFDHVGTRARRESAGLLRERIDTQEGPVVVLGDLNTGTGRAAYDRLVNGDFRRPLADARHRAAAVDGPATTLTDFAELREDRRVDHVLVTPEFDVLAVTVDDARFEGRFPSDHLPVVADLAPPTDRGDGG